MAEFTAEKGTMKGGYLLVDHPTETMELPAVAGGIWVNVDLEGLRDEATPNVRTSFASATGTNERSHTLSKSASLMVNLYVRSADPQVEKEQLNLLEGDDKRGSWKENDPTGTPTVAAPLKGGLLHIPRINWPDGTIATATELDLTWKVSGPIACLTAPLPAPAAYAIEGAPTVDTITVKFNADPAFMTEYATLRVVRRFVIDYRTTLPTPGPWTEFVRVDNPGAGEVQVAVTGLSATTEYEVRGRQEWAFGALGTAASITASTTA